MQPTIPKALRIHAAENAVAAAECDFATTCAAGIRPAPTLLDTLDFSLAPEDEAQLAVDCPDIATHRTGYEVTFAAFYRGMWGSLWADWQVERRDPRVREVPA